ncbi:hypothetical protein C7S13_3915 [Burkholderia cepacia]|nr:hypothetical protein [Burkholderia cepacia]
MSEKSTIAFLTSTGKNIHAMATTTHVTTTVETALRMTAVAFSW